MRNKLIYDEGYVYILISTVKKKVLIFKYFILYEFIHI